MTLSIICALTTNSAIGNKGGLLYYLPANLKHFKNLTTGHTIVMGRKTFESLQLATGHISQKPECISAVILRRGISKLYFI